MPFIDCGLIPGKWGFFLSLFENEISDNGMT